MQKLTNRTPANNSQFPTSSQPEIPSSPAARQNNKLVNSPDEETGREHAHIIAPSSPPNVDVISDTKCCCFFNRRTRQTNNKQTRK